MELQEKLKIWADEVVKYCNKTAIREDVNKTFYAFQKSVLPIKEENRELLILGLNPGGSYDFASQYTNSIWQANERFNEKEMTSKGLLLGNPCFTNYQKWDISKLSMLECVKSILDTGNYYFMNFIYFNTSNINEFDEIDKDGKIREQCIAFTNQFIKLINPKRILILGTQKGIDALPNVKNPKIILNSTMRLVVQAELLGYPAIAIPHPSRYHMRKQEELDAMNATLQKLFKGEQVEKITLDVQNFCL